MAHALQSRSDSRSRKLRTTTSLYSAQTRRTFAQAAQEELKLRKLETSLVSREEVERAMFAIARQVRDSLSNLPARLSGLFAAESDQNVIFELFTRELQQALEEVSREPTGSVEQEPRRRVRRARVSRRVKTRPR